MVMHPKSFSRTSGYDLRDIQTSTNVQVLMRQTSFKIVRFHINNQTSCKVLQMTDVVSFAKHFMTFDCLYVYGIF